jgi:hypothetical protein
MKTSRDLIPRLPEDKFLSVCQDRGAKGVIIYYFLYLRHKLTIDYFDGIRTTIRNFLVFYACFLKRPTVTCVLVIYYEVFFKKELLVFFHHEGHE